MKLKRQPDDFQVEEIPLVQPGERGRYVFYRLSKTGLGTLEALEAIRRRWNLPERAVQYGGLKDRHARTVQYLTILEGPNQPIRQSNFTLEPIGWLPHPYGPGHFRGNRFTVVIRNLGQDAAARAARAIADLPRDGLPNYFDDQRFGSVAPGGGFIAQAWLRGDAERALWLAIAEPNPSDRPDIRKEKAILSDSWGRWAEAKARLPRSHSRSLVTYLADHPADFRGAFARLRRDLRSLYFSAYQSHLWNLMLGRLIERMTRHDQRFPLEFKVARLPIHRGLDEEHAAALAAFKIPMPSSRNPLPAGLLGEVAADVLREAGLAWESIRVRHLKDVFFSKGSRDALFFAANLLHDTAPDDLYPGRLKLSLSFELPKGAYATLVVKRITEVG
jgi:tRNA pseudouridine13 synthase